MERNLARYSEFLPPLPLAMASYRDLRILPITAYYQAKLIVSNSCPASRATSLDVGGFLQTPVGRKPAGGNGRAMSWTESGVVVQGHGPTLDPSRCSIYRCYSGSVSCLDW